MKVSSAAASLLIALLDLGDAAKVFDHRDNNDFIEVDVRYKNRKGFQDLQKEGDLLQNIERYQVTQWKWNVEVLKEHGQALHLYGGNSLMNHLSMLNNTSITIGILIDINDRRRKWRLYMSLRPKSLMVKCIRYFWFNVLKNQG